MKNSFRYIIILLAVVILCVILYHIFRYYNAIEEGFVLNSTNVPWSDPDFAATFATSMNTMTAIDFTVNTQASQSQIPTTTIYINNDFTTDYMKIVLEALSDISSININIDQRNATNGFNPKITVNTTTDIQANARLQKPEFQTLITQALVAPLNKITSIDVTARSTCDVNTNNLQQITVTVNNKPFNIMPSLLAFLRITKNINITMSDPAAIGNIKFAWYKAVVSSTDTSKLQCLFKLFPDLQNAYNAYYKSQDAKYTIPTKDFCMYLKDIDPDLYQIKCPKMDTYVPQFAAVAAVTPTDNLNSYISRIGGLYARYQANNYNIGTNTWLDSSPNGNNLPSTQIVNNNISVTSNKRQNGAYGNFSIVCGTHQTKITFTRTKIPMYTIIYICRYAGKRRQRIINGNSGNWLSGFWAGNSGCAYHEGWITNVTPTHGNNWFISVDSGNLYRSNGVTRSSGVGRTTSLPPFGINSVGGCCSNESSDFEMADMMIFNRVLTTDEYSIIEKNLSQIYGIKI